THEASINSNHNVDERTIYLCTALSRRPELAPNDILSGFVAERKHILVWWRVSRQPAGRRVAEIVRKNVVCACSGANRTTGRFSGRLGWALSPTTGNDPQRQDY